MDAANDTGYTALHWAAQNCDKDGIGRLLSAGADANISTESGLTPIELVLGCNLPDGQLGEMITLLLRGGAKPSPRAEQWATLVELPNIASMLTTKATDGGGGFDAQKPEWLKPKVNIEEPLTLQADGEKKDDDTVCEVRLECHDASEPYTGWACPTDAPWQAEAKFRRALGKDLKHRHCSSESAEGATWVARFDSKGLTGHQEDCDQGKGDRCWPDPLHW